jgi:hypothetical protein
MRPWGCSGAVAHVVPCNKPLSRLLRLFALRLGMLAIKAFPQTPSRAACNFQDMEKGGALAQRGAGRGIWKGQPQSAASHRTTTYICVVLQEAKIDVIITYIRSLEEPSPLNLLLPAINLLLLLLLLLGQLQLLLSPLKKCRQPSSQCRLHPAAIDNCMQ